MFPAVFCDRSERWVKKHAAARARRSRSRGRNVLESFILCGRDRLSRRWVCFADDWRTKDEYILRVGYELARGQLADQSLIDRRLKCEIEFVEGLHGRKVRDLQPHGGARPLFRVDFLAEHRVEEVEIRRRLPRGVIEHRVDPLGHIAQAEARQLLHDPRVDHDAHRAPPIASA